jgi:hypothetical protein
MHQSFLALNLPDILSIGLKPCNLQHLPQNSPVALHAAGVPTKEWIGFAAGAVLVAKLTLGALAQGDKWFGGMTRNPWNTKQGSSGSSAHSIGLKTQTKLTVCHNGRPGGVNGCGPDHRRVASQSTQIHRSDQCQT